MREENKLKKWTTAKFKKEFWKTFAQYIKLRDGSTCYTCGRTNLEGANCQAGHFIPKAAGGLALYFHEDNVHVQCSYCNLNLEGNHYEYGKRLGEKKVQELYQLKNEIVKYDKHDYLRLIKEYEEKMRQLP